ncbi:MAG: isoaspartyl peptidase/L-asparaginase, partial [Deltaproteobacteria bacterium]|nr:isoaspartyl peptidase/L-asparaginase [Deltaproteobacteria bacterium]
MIVCHGGAGLIGPERHDRLRAGVRAAAEHGHAILARGGSALDAVVAAVRVLEDDP